MGGRPGVSKKKKNPTFVKLVTYKATFLIFIEEGDIKNRLEAGEESSLYCHLINKVHKLLHKPVAGQLLRPKDEKKFIPIAFSFTCHVKINFIKYKKYHLNPSKNQPPSKEHMDLEHKVGHPVILYSKINPF